MYYVVLPALGLGGLAAAAPVAFAIFQHLLFGVAVGAAYVPFQPRMRSPYAPRIESATFRDTRHTG
ncbi:MAG TPA: hypothetical protein VJ814_09300 [Gaiellaceae bacterium]|nr:hypothetical protein [Gaiellaceae bacterium]